MQSKRHLLALSALLALALPALAQRAEVPVPEDIAKLIPADAFAYIQFSSLDEIDQSVTRMTELMQAPSSEMMTMSQALSVMPANTALIDRGRPLALVISLPNGTEEPTLTFVVPTVDASRFVDSVFVEPGTGEPVSEGDYVALPQSPAYRPATFTPELMKTVPAGHVSAVVDLRKVIDHYSEEIQMGIAQGAMMLENMGAMGAVQLPGLDFESAMGEVMEGVQTFLDSAESLSVAMSFDGGSMELCAAFTAMEGSPLAGWADERGVDPGRLAGYLPEGAPLAALCALDLGALNERLQPYVGQLFGGHGPELSGGLAAWRETFDRLYHGFGDEMAFAVGAGSEGLELSYFFAAQDGPTQAAEFLGRFEQDILSVEGLEWLGPELEEVGGLEVTSYTLSFGPPTMSAGLFGPDADPVEAMGPWTNMIYGEGGLRFSIAAREDVMLLSVGNAEHTRSDVEALVAGPGEIPPGFARAAQEVRGATRAFATTIDLRALIVDMLDTARRFGDPGPVPADVTEGAPVEMNLWGAMHDRTWFGGIHFDIAQMEAYGQMLQNF